MKSGAPPLVLALLLALCPSRALAQAAPPPGATREELDRAMERGIDYLLRAQEIDGSWRYMQSDYLGGQTALCLYTLLKSGVSREHHAVQRALAFLRHAPDPKTYSQSVLILALSALDDPAERPWILRLAERLVATQDGGFAYPDGEPDLSNTQYGALALAAAARAGCEVPAKSWQRMAQSVLAWQDGEGGFFYREGSLTSGAMTAAGLSTVVLCEQGLEGASTPAQLRTLLVKARESGLDWLAQHFSVEFNPVPADPNGKEQRWTFYYLYGLERVGAFLKTDSIGTRDWYREGARFLVRSQAGEGNWGSPYGETEPNTCFALLFLRRATAAPSTGSGDARVAKGIVPDDPAADVGLRTSGDSPLAAWIASFGKNARALYAWPGEEERGLRLVRVAYQVDGEEVAGFDADPSRPSSEHFPIKHRFTKTGRHVLQARVELDAPPVDGSRPARVVLESAPLEIEVGSVLEDWMLAYPEDRERNVIGEVRASDVTASSSFNDDWRPEFALDKLQARGWLAKEGDATPTLRIEFPRPVRASRIVVSHAHESGVAPNTWSRARSIAVTVNKRAPQVFPVDPDERKKSAFDLGRTEKILRLELKLCDLEPGKDPRHAAGLQEVELQLPEERTPGPRAPGAAGGR